MFVSLAGGNAFFIGMALVTGAFASNYRIIWPWQGAIAKLAALGGAILVFLSSTPFSESARAIWSVLFLAAMAESFFPEPSRCRSGLLGALATLSALLCLFEAPHHFAPKIPVDADRPVYVIGDSISAGVRSQERNWPAVLGDMARLRVINLAVAGATTSSALPQLNEIKHPNSLVFVEIGGNDLLRGVSSARFREDLDVLLSKLCNQRVVMFELPLYPFRSEYGKAQRELARQHGVLLIPKRYMARVIGGDGRTIDGLHLSQRGHDEFAASIYRLLRIE